MADEYDAMDVDRKASILNMFAPQFSIIHAMMVELVTRIRQPSVSGMMSGPTTIVYEFLESLHEIAYSNESQADGVLAIVEGIKKIFIGFGWNFTTANTINGNGFSGPIDPTHLANVLESSIVIGEVDDAKCFDVIAPPILPMDVKWISVFGTDKRKVHLVKYISEVILPVSSTPLYYPLGIQQDFVPVVALWVGGNTIDVACPIIISMRCNVTPNQNVNCDLIIQPASHHMAHVIRHKKIFADEWTEPIADWEHVSTDVFHVGGLDSVKVQPDEPKVISSEMKNWIGGRASGAVRFAHPHGDDREIYFVVMEPWTELEQRVRIRLFWTTPFGR